MLRVAALIALVVFTCAVTMDRPAIAEVWSTKGRILGPSGRTSTDVSGIACSSSQGFPRRCLVIDDNRQSAQFVTLRDGRLIAGESVRLIDNSYNGRQLQLDGEGVAYSDGFFYVIGSHGHPRDSAHKLRESSDAAEIRAQTLARSQIVKLSAEHGGAAPAIQRTGRLRDIIAAEPVLSPFADRPLEENGVTIEGIAVREGRVFVGFRGPALDDGRAAVLSVALDALFGDKSPDPVLFRLPLGNGQGVRDLAPFGDGILILAGPTGGAPGPYALYWWDAQGEGVRRLKDLTRLAGKSGKRKPEGLLPLDRTPSCLRVLILFDGVKGGGPRTVVVPQQ